MLLNSLPYLLVFLPVVGIAVFACPASWRWRLLLLSSWLFYAFLKVPYLLAALGFSTLFTYWIGSAIGRQADERRQLLLLWTGVSGNLVLLVGLKYNTFISNTLNSVLGWELGPGMVFVSIGVSFFVFQAISYLADVYLGSVDPEDSLGHFALYMAFFPKLLQGPIERSGDLLPQLKQPIVFNYANVRDGLFLIGWGLFKKLVIADRLGLFVDPVFDNVHAHTAGATFVLATYAFAFQLYFDFSGYTDMAIGTARLFGIRLSPNFNSPYLATGVADFWRRWHISFSRWVLDYLFKPLQMKWRRWQNAGAGLALLITFFISGLWHGAGWGYVIWGLLQGLFLTLGIYWKPWQKRIHRGTRLEGTSILRAWQVFLTFNLVCLSWVFFRAKTVEDAFYVIQHVLSFRAPGEAKTFLLSLGKPNLAALLLLFTVTALVSWFKNQKGSLAHFTSCPSFVRWGLAYLILFGLLALRTSGGQFIYLQF